MILPPFSTTALGKFPFHFCCKDTAEVLRLGKMFRMHFFQNEKYNERGKKDIAYRVFNCDN